MSPSTRTGFARRSSDLARRASSWSREGLRARARHVFLNLAGTWPRSAEPVFLRCLYMHYVYDDQVEAFRDLLGRLEGLGTFISADRVHAIVTGREPLDGRYFHLSIDDGFDNVYRNAFPVMADLGIPATVFVPTRFVGLPDDAVADFWWDPGRTLNRPLDWPSLREMHARGIDIGAHTRHHVRLSSVSRDPARLRDEIEGSKQDLETQMGVPCRFMSWPFGTWSDIDDTAFRAIESAGYDMCFSAVRGKVEPGETSVLAVPRHHFEPEWPWPHVKYFASGGKE